MGTVLDLEREIAQFAVFDAKRIGDGRLALSPAAGFSRHIRVGMTGWSRKARGTTRHGVVAPQGYARKERLGCKEESAS